MMELKYGTRLGRYTLIANFQSNPSSATQVWKARDSWGRVVVIKAVSANDKKYLERERQLAAVSKDFTIGSQIAQILEVGEVGGWAYAVREFIHGRVLAPLKDPDLADPLVVYEFVKQFSAILAVIHANNVIHCDVKPGNIIAVRRRSWRGGYRWTFVLLDFGISTKIDEVGELRNQTMIGSGTFRYMSPEQLEAREPGADVHPLIGPATDIHALCVLLHEWLTGEVNNKKRFPLETLSELCLRSEFEAAFDARILIQLFRKGLNPDPRQRIASVQEFQDSFLSSCLPGFCEEHRLPLDWGALHFRRKLNRLPKEWRGPEPAKPDARTLAGIRRLQVYGLLLLLSGIGATAVCLAPSQPVVPRGQQVEPMEAKVEAMEAKEAFESTLSILVNADGSPLPLERSFRDSILNARSEAQDAEELFSLGHSARAAKRWNEATRLLDGVNCDGPTVLSALMAASKDENPLIRWRAIYALGEVHAAPDIVVPRLMETVDHETNEVVRVAAIKALGKFGGAAKAAVPKLCRLSGSDMEWWISRLLAVEAISLIEPPSVEVDDLPFFGPLIHRPAAMGERPKRTPSRREFPPPKDVIEEATELSQFSDVIEGAIANRALSRKFNRYYEHAAHSSKIHDAYQALEGHQGPWYQGSPSGAPFQQLEDCDAALHKMHGDPLAGLKEQLQEQGSHVRCAAAQLLGCLRPPRKEAVAELIRVLENDDDWKCRQTAAWSLGCLGATAKPANRALAVALLLDHPDVAVQCGIALGAINFDGLDDDQTRICDLEVDIPRKRRCDEAIDNKPATEGEGSIE